MQSQSSSSPIVLLVDAQEYMIVECGDGFSSNFKAFDILTKKNSESAPEHSMFYLTLKAFSKKYETIILLSSNDNTKYYQSTVERLNKEEPQKYILINVTVPISKYERLGDKYISQEKCLGRLKNLLDSLKGNVAMYDIRHSRKLYR